MVFGSFIPVLLLIVVLTISVFSSRIIANETWLKLLPSFLIFMVIGIMAQGVIDGAASLGDTSKGAYASSLGFIQKIGLFLLVAPSCAGLRIDRTGRCLSEAAALTTGAFLAFGLALVSIPFVHSMVADTSFQDEGGHRLLAHFIVLSLGAMVTSLPFLTKIFRDTGLLGSQFAKSILLSASIVDIIVWIIFAFAVSLFQEGYTLFGVAVYSFVKTILEIAFLYLLGVLTAFVVIKLGHGWKWVGYLAIFCVSVFTLGLTYLLEQELIIGMVLVGLALGGFQNRIPDAIKGFEGCSDRLGAPIYFTCVGLGLAIGVPIDTAIIIVFIIWSSVIKVGSVMLVMRFLRDKTGSSLDFAIAMNTRGGPGLVLAAASYSVGLIGIGGFGAMTAASIITAIFTEHYLKRSRSRLSGATTTT